jgi:hypothetical protein
VRNESVFFLEKRDWTMTRWNDNGTTEPYGDPDPDPSGDPIRPSTPPSVLRFFADTLYYVPGKSSSTGANVSEFRFFPMGEAGWITGLTRTETGPVHADFIHEGRWYLLAENGHLESMSPPWGRFQRMAPIPGFSFPYTGSNDRPFFAVHGDTAFLLYRDAALVHVLSYDITGNAWSKVVDFPNLGGKWAIADVAGKIYLANGTTLMRLDY